MRKLQSQGVHHITLTGADRQTSIDFWEGVLGMPFIFEQPNLDAPDEPFAFQGVLNWTAEGSSHDGDLEILPQLRSLGRRQQERPHPPRRRQPRDAHELSASLRYLLLINVPTP